jgi:hypothetical protein
MVFSWYEWKGRALPDHAPGRQLLGALQIIDSFQDRGSIGYRKDNGSGLDRGANVKQLELKIGHNSKVATTPAEGPKQIRVLFRVAVDKLSFGCHDIGPN